MLPDVLSWFPSAVLHYALVKLLFGMCAGGNWVKVREDQNV